MPGHTYLILPMAPTPNGRLHVGHLAGPYLRADALARRLRRDGETVLLASGTDAYENWVEYEAQRNDESPSETCRRNFEGIGRDLTQSHVSLDLWIDPLDPRHERSYAEFHEQLLGEFVRGGTATLREEQVPVSTVSGDYAFGPWLAGDCPSCDAHVAGNSCVRCGAGFQPSEIRNPRSRADGSPVTWQTRSSWFVEPDDREGIAAAIAEAGTPPELLSVVHSHLDRTGTLVRVSQPGSWGIRSRLVDEDCVITNTWYAYCLYLAELAGPTLDQPGNALDRQSEVTVVSLFGKDNAGIGLVAPYAIARSSGRFRAFDSVAVNHLLAFEGEKCSTSRRHGIWVSELIEGTSITGDELRSVLSQMPLEHEPASLSLGWLVDSVRWLRQWEAQMLPRYCALAASTTDPGANLRVREALARQAEALQPQRLHLAEATEVLKAWMVDPPDLSDSRRVRSWLAGFALLGEPILPDLAQRLWQALGLPARPLATQLEHEAPVEGWELRPPVPLSREEVESHAWFAESAQ